MIILFAFSAVKGWHGWVQEIFGFLNSIPAGPDEPLQQQPSGGGGFERKYTLVFCYPSSLTALRLQFPHMNMEQLTERQIRSDAIPSEREPRCRTSHARYWITSSIFFTTVKRTVKSRSNSGTAASSPNRGSRVPEDTFLLISISTPRRT